MGDGGFKNPLEIKIALGKYNRTFADHGQHDSSEALNAMLGFISDDLFKDEKRPYIDVNIAGDGPEEASKKTWAWHLTRNKSIIKDLFAGLFKSTIKCIAC